MRILIISNYFPPKFVGGAEMCAYRMGVELVKRGTDVDVITSRSINENPVEEEVEGMRVHRIVPRLFINNVKPYNPFSLYCFNSLFNPLSYKMLPLIRKIRPDLIHMHMINFFDLSTLVKSLDGPAVWTIHDYWPICPLGSLINFDKGRLCTRNCEECIYPPPFQRISKFQLSRRAKALNTLERKIDSLITPSNFMKKKLIDFSFTRDGKARMLRNGVNTDDFQYTPVQPSKIVLFVGKLIWDKGCFHLLKAMFYVLKRIPDARLFMIGTRTGRDERALRSFIKNLNMEKNVELLKETFNIINYYQKAHVVVLPSLLLENCSMVLLEAMASGRPVIASKLGGNSELVDDGLTGFLVDPEDCHQLSEKIIYILSHGDLARKMGEATREKAEKELNMENHIQNLMELYKSIT